MPQQAKLSNVISNSPLPNTFFQCCDELFEYERGTRRFDVVDVFAPNEIQVSFVFVSYNELWIMCAR